ncbi:TetR/AcrR family transcriptional regulator C-terminal domain-containing protein [Alphaproteobacteria bacterium]|nr:TetR/AcrR family transcriptional regulator C-terminal domain-containing protein [Alphaproteobacteria bacterium]
MGQKLWAKGPGSFQNLVAEYLWDQGASGTLIVPDPRLSASLVQGMEAGPCFLQMIFTGINVGEGERTDQIIDAAVTLFRSGHLVTSRIVDLLESQENPFSLKGIGRNGG